MSSLKQAKDLLMLEEQIKDNTQLLNLIMERAEIEIVELTKIVEWHQGLINNKRQMISVIQNQLGEQYAITSKQNNQGKSETTSL